ncbi:hypothetical protein GJ744_000494 [Endocarpon pusillum]|uniref:chitinase n=1 Tax=Endocarpon pusillum TaxID=364733 RepID=A0A8H7AAT3_9EURO|nr:hypothetical protein GJ744_000494 [Endocarpon pusillum]
MQTYGFDGVDIDWECPVAPERGGIPADYRNYVSFLKNLKAALGSSGHNYGLTLTLPSSYWYMQHFDIIAMEKIVDWFNVMTYDLHGTWDSTDRFIGPICQCSYQSYRDRSDHGPIDPDNIVMGLGFYGRSFTLANSGCSTPGCSFSSGGGPGKCSASAGTLMFSEVQGLINDGVAPTLDKEAAVKQVVWDNNQWVSFDDAETFKLKIDYANQKCLGGTMVWAVSTDDGNYTAAAAYSKHNGLSNKAVFSPWLGTPTPPKEVVNTCVGGDCDANCPAGTQPVQTGSGKDQGNIGIFSFCKNGKSRNYCCPSGREIPKCSWRSGKYAPFCGGSCDKAEVQVATESEDCWTGHKALCCSSTQSDAAIGQCKWEGAAPFCGRHGRVGEHYGCDEDDRYEETYDSTGSIGDQWCFCRYKSFCCTKPPPFANCNWSSKDSPWLHPFICPTGCGPDQQIVAQDPTKLLCDVGSSFYCCDAPTSSTDDNDLSLNFCVPLDNDYLLSNEYDDDGNPADIIELYWYENQVFVVPNDADPSIDHYNHPEVCLPDGECFKIPEVGHPDVQALLVEIQSNWTSTTVKRTLESSDELIKRGRARSSLVRFPTNRRVRFIAATYNTVAELAGRGRKFWSTPAGKISKTICLNNAASFLGRQLGRKYVTEHVTELQTRAQFAQSLADNKYPDGTVPQGIATNYDWEQVFGDNGYMKMTWTQLGVARPAGLSGKTPIESIYRALGSKGADGDDSNLLVCDAATNSLKTSAWAMHSNIIGTERWKHATPQQRLSFLNNIDQSLVPYLNSAEAQAALKHGYDTQQAGLHKEWYSRFFYEVNANLQIFYQAKVQSEITNWAGGSQAYAAYKAVQRNKIVSNLRGRSSIPGTLTILYAFVV